MLRARILEKPVISGKQQRDIWKRKLPHLWKTKKLLVTLELKAYVGNQ